MEIWTGFIVGLLGSFHCIGMCGPIAIALPVFGESKLKIMFDRVLYNLGRAVSYSLMGAVFGLLGSRVAIYGLQQNLSIALGAIIIIYVLTPQKIKNKISDTLIYIKFIDSFRLVFSKLISRKSDSSLFSLGILNGFLPCGFVYVGIAGAISTGNFLSGAFYMALFGLGTFPIMFGVSVIGKTINAAIRKRINKLIPVLAILLAVIFILRGLNLGIPYLSPRFMTAAQSEVICR